MACLHKQLPDGLGLSLRLRSVSAAWPPGLARPPTDRQPRLGFCCFLPRPPASTSSARSLLTCHLPTGSCLPHPHLTSPQSHTQSSSYRIALSLPRCAWPSFNVSLCFSLPVDLFGANLPINVSYCLPAPHEGWDCAFCSPVYPNTQPTAEQ